MDILYLVNDNFHNIINALRIYSFFIHSLLQVSSLESILLLLYFFYFLHGTIMARCILSLIMAYLVYR